MKQNCAHLINYKILFAILLSFYFSNSFAQSIDEDMSKPKIKTVKEISYLVEDSQIKDRNEVFETNPDWITKYDKNGKIIETIYYKKNGELLLKIVYERDRKGEILKIIMKNPSDNLKSYSINKQNKDKTIKEILTYNKDNKLIKIVSNKYNKEKKLIETLIKDSLNDKGWRKIYNYNIENKITEELQYKTDGLLIEKKTYFNIDNLNKTLQYSYKSDGSFKMIISEYDKMNNLILQKWINEKDEITSEACFEYIYDYYGNWITQKKYFSDNFIFITEKEITYWEEK